MHILDALLMIPFGLYSKKRKASKYCTSNIVTPTAQKGKNKPNHDVIISCVIAPRAGLPRGTFG